MDLRDLRFEAVAPGADGARRYRYALGGLRVHAVMPPEAATVWRQARPGAGDAELDDWARHLARRLIAERLERAPLDVSDVLLDRDLGPPGGTPGQDRPRDGEAGMPGR